VIDHLSLGVADLERAVAFYGAALTPLGLVLLHRSERGAGFGPPGADEDVDLFAIGTGARAPGPGFHVAFAAASRAAVDVFHAVALRAGGADEGPPGLRPAYGPGYYAAFVRDLDGHRIEAVCHEQD